MRNFAALVYVGPGETETRRFRELLDSIACYEPGIAQVVVIDDASALDFSSLTPPQLAGRVVVIPNPRQGRGNWWVGGLCVGLTAGYKWLAENALPDFVVRLDTDALVIAPFAERIGRRFASQPEVGLLGTFHAHPVKGGKRSPSREIAQNMPRILRKLQWPLAVWRHSHRPTRGQCILRRGDRVNRQVIRRAIQNGYRDGEFVQGGGYAVSGEVLRRSARAGFLREPLGYLPLDFSEDHLATLLCYASGLVPCDFNQKGEVFAVAYSYMPGHPTDLLADGYAIVHTIKNGPVPEAEAVAIFRNARHRSGGRECPAATAER